jgi:predicted metal-dependent hydrolase
VTGTDVELKPRRVSFDWSQVPVQWVPDDPLTTHTIDVLHLLLPAGERWFVHIYKQVLPMITDERLKADVKGFMGQEAVHARAHTAVLDHLDAHGLDPTPFTKDVEFLFNRLGGDDAVPAFMRSWWLIARVGVVAAIEHFTAVLGAWILDSPALDEAGADPTMLDLLRWHGAEEVEHRSVAFDVFQHISGNWFRRVLAMMIVAPTMVWLFRRGARFLCSIDPGYDGPLPTMRDYARAAKRRRLPARRELLLAVPRYCRPSYHPSQEGDTCVALAYLAASPAAIAAAA